MVRSVYVTTKLSLRVARGTVEAFVDVWRVDKVFSLNILVIKNKM